MSQQAAVTLNGVVYNPAGAEKGIVFWYDRSGGVAGSFSPLTQGYSANVGAAKRTKVSFRVELPTVATVDSAYAKAGQVIRNSSFQGEFWLDPTATEAERADIRARAKDLIDSALVTSAIEDLDPAYA